MTLGIAVLGAGVSLVNYGESIFLHRDLVVKVRVVICSAAKYLS